MNGKLCVLASCLLLLQACGTWQAKQVDVAPLNKHFHNLAVHQQVVLTTAAGAYQRFEALIESSPGALKIALISEFGENLMTLAISDGRFQVTERSLTSGAIDTQLLALSLQRIFWPENLLRPFALAQRWRIVPRPDSREFYSGDALIATASYSEANPWHSEIRYIDIEHGFELVVNSVQLTP